MAFLSLETGNYRNLKAGAIDTGASFVFFVGENGQGKSNILDALYTICYGSSFRRGTDADSSRIGSRDWFIKATIGPLDGNDQSSGSLLDTMVVSWDARTKTIRENGKAISDRKYLVEKYPAIVFCHEDMDFVSGEPERRRFFFDQTIGLVKNSYIDSLRNYKKCLKMKNAALKEHMFDVLDAIDVQLITYGLELQRFRNDLMAGFNETFTLCYNKISAYDRVVQIAYRPSWKSYDFGEVSVNLASGREREIMLGTNLSGPHRDRFYFMDEEGDFSLRASTGQRRLMSLVLRIAQAEYYVRETGNKPILLLDDVLLELDPEKRKRFMQYLPPARQAFFTFLPGEPFKDYLNHDTIVYWTDDGHFLRT
ncbi:MAG: hypothetical protein A2087_07610 [Spirochaetes bacterium GWD1_61_31]|nr:MAG: hypothetical protein A2Y37_07860 [Spirochaetes bacterium GWB1_60_80]OHD34272.1 MAG: hypothetical protein A2004_12890 [Spirochaetes bacterium GWC1_61_12]OHD40200.1 MAG: hypothetical protein A2087_07610 [Spirochaetes bacterium GWD1_61_31]OHD45752.1 MAG: hypothetical protein A2Y35_03495 [Spirochaetes bacterium GWE1_60_18]OHD58297.1 MAG: hypothetical protein A2Y32_05885 [Spirochaetes bacterium GWF1_60_12]HAX37338.1 DNA replication and repair protein RecF [Spirochaetaceae bacterium]